MNEAVTFTEAIRQATEQALTNDPRVHVMGLGANYPNGLDGTMGDLAVRFPDRVHDMPCSENANTGMAVGMAIAGLRPLVHHGRIEFALHAMDQIVTQAAKWNFMFGGNYPCPLALRIAMGRQWGNGPQHTLNHKLLFSIPGLKVVCPSTPEQAKWLLLAALEDPGPVVYLEPRWLYKTREAIAQIPYTELGRARLLRSGKDATIVTVGDAVLDALKASSFLEEQLRMRVGVVDLVSIHPLDVRLAELLYGDVYVLDSSPDSHGFGYAVTGFLELKGITVKGLTSALSTSCPTAPGLTKDYYPTWQSIVRYIAGSNSDSIPTETFEQCNLPPTDNFTDLITTALLDESNE